VQKEEKRHKAIRGTGLGGLLSCQTPRLPHCVGYRYIDYFNVMKQYNSCKRKTRNYVCIYVTSECRYILKFVKF
jgi:hypothetical protein